MNDELVTRDERTISVENASYRLAYTIVSFGLLISVAVRGLLFNEASWDLLGLVIVSSLVATFYQGKLNALPRRWALMALVVGLVSAVVAAALTLLLHGVRH